MLRALPIVLTLALASSGCERSAASSPKRPSAEAGLAALSTRSDMNGERLDLEGSDATVVVVFATWCSPCRKELKVLGELRKARPNVAIVGLNAYEEFRDWSDQTKLTTFLSTNAPWLTVVRDDGTLLKRFGGVPKIPSMFIYDRDGRAVHEFRRNKRPPPDVDELAAAIDSAVKRG